VTFLIPIPPSLNNAYATVMTKHGRMKRVKKADIAPWRKEAWAELHRQKAPKLAAGWYTVDMAISPQTRGDIDNRIKMALDLLVKLGFTPDDKWLWRVTIERSEEVPAKIMRLSYQAVAP
jgi:Holliday junction resolvase RusA-like endonuclease